MARSLQDWVSSTSIRAPDTAAAFVTVSISAVPTPRRRALSSKTQRLLMQKRLFQVSREPSAKPSSVPFSNAPKATGSSSHSLRKTSSKERSSGAASGT